MSELFVEANGLRFFVQDEAEGDAVLLLHGFPDTHAMWRNQVAALTEAGYRCVVPDLRGRGASDKPHNVEDYFAPLLIADATGILDALGIEQAHVVGHDWGAALAWFMAMFVPDRIRTMTAISVGHPASWSWPSEEQRKRSWYMPFFHLPIAERALPHDGWRLLREWTRDHPETASHIEALTPNGALVAGLNWYRAIAVGGWFSDPIPWPPVTCPALGIIGDDDHLLTVEQMAASNEHAAGPWRCEVIDGGGHWLPLDEPERINELVLEGTRQLP